MSRAATGQPPVPHPTAPAGLPVQELRRRLRRLNEIYAWLVTDMPGTCWARQGDTTAMCQEMLLLSDRMEILIEAAHDVRQSASLLFDLSHNEGEKRGVFSSSAPDRGAASDPR